MPRGLQQTWGSGRDYAAPAAFWSRTVIQRNHHSSSEAAAGSWKIGSYSKTGACTASLSSIPKVWEEPATWPALTYSPVPPFAKTNWYLLVPCRLGLLLKVWSQGQSSVTLIYRRRTGLTMMKRPRSLWESTRSPTSLWSADPSSCTVALTNWERTMYSKQQSPQRLVPLPLVSWRLYQTFTVCMLDFITVPQAPSIKPLFMLHWCMKVK